METKLSYGTQTPVVGSEGAFFNSSQNLSSSCLWLYARDVLHLLGKEGRGKEDNKMIPCL